MFLFEYVFELRDTHFCKRYTPMLGASNKKRIFRGVCIGACIGKMLHFAIDLLLFAVALRAVMHALFQKRCFMGVVFLRFDKHDK